MRSPASAVKPSPVVLAAVILVFALSAFAQNSSPLVAPPSANSINMLVLGDSILWGQGLKDEHKSWYLVKAWLEGSNGIRVHETVVAHAGAVIGTAGEKPPQSLTLYGEVSSAWPTLHDQVDDALRAFADPAEVDVVLVDGCINDVNHRRFLNAANTTDAIKALAEEKCGPPVESLLARIAASFPNAHIIISGYYPVVSEKTPSDLFMRALAKRFYAASTPNSARPSGRELLKQLALVSAVWYEASNHSLMQGVANVNAQLSAKGSRQQVLFAKIPFQAEHAFAARDSRLWGFDATTLRKLLAVLTFGRVSLYANDEVRRQRSSVCKDFFKKIPGETDQEKATRKDHLLTCSLASIAHPNRKGAVMYAEAIKEQMQAFIRSPGWLRTTVVSGSNVP
jgi:lysophospholipase L1-like esterase